MSADGRSRAGGTAGRRSVEEPRWPRKAIGLPAYLVKDWGTTLRAALLASVVRLTAGSVGAPDTVKHGLASAFEAVQLTGAWLPWSMLGCVASVEAVRRVRALRAGPTSSGQTALGAALPPAPGPDDLDQGPDPNGGTGAVSKKAKGKKGKGRNAKNGKKNARIKPAESAISTS